MPVAAVLADDEVLQLLQLGPLLAAPSGIAWWPPKPGGRRVPAQAKLLIESFMKPVSWTGLGLRSLHPLAEAPCLSDQRYGQLTNLPRAPPSLQADHAHNRPRGARLHLWRQPRGGAGRHCGAAGGRGMLSVLACPPQTLAASIGAIHCSLALSPRAGSGCACSRAAVAGAGGRAAG